MHATGHFLVLTAPQPAPALVADTQIGLLTIDKAFHGALEARSVGEMLSYRTAVQGSAAYVAIECVSGTLDGRHGSFVLHHSGTMDHGSLSQSVTVVPDSGTNQLAGLRGSMTIQVDAQGNHTYAFDYSLP